MIEDISKEEFILQKKRAIADEIIGVAGGIVSLLPTSKNKKAFRKSYTRKPTKGTRYAPLFNICCQIDMMRYRIELIKSQPYPRFPKGGMPAQLAIIGESGSEIILNGKLNINTPVGFTNNNYTDLNKQLPNVNFTSA